jgi:Tol biopolymer transport system component
MIEQHCDLESFLGRRLRMHVITCAVISTAITGFSTAQSALTTRVSVGPGGAEGNNSSWGASISDDARYIAFNSYASTLAAGDTNVRSDIFVRDRQTGTTTRVSVDSNGVQSDGDSFHPALSADGRYVAFESVASNLAQGDTNGVYDVFVHDNVTGTTTRVSVDSSGAQADGISYAASISSDGRYVAFQSGATNLVPGDTNGVYDIFVHDNVTGTTTRVSVSSTGAQANHDCTLPSICGDGHLVAFQSTASNLVPGDTNGFNDVFVHDLTNGATRRVSMSVSGAEGDGESIEPRLSRSGRLVVFSSLANNLIPGDSNNGYDVFLRDLVTLQTTLVSVTTGGYPAGNYSRRPAISADERWVAFDSRGWRLVHERPHDVFNDVYVRNIAAGHTVRMSVSTSGAPGNDASQSPVVSGDGRFVAFESAAYNLVDDDSNPYSDVFVRDQFATGATSFCDPGVAGVIPCPCANAPTGLGRGCDNSSATGGASVAATGYAYLSFDSVTLTTSDEISSTMSIVMQGDASSPSGIVFGQGVRCASGSLQRLYTKTASAGSISAPDRAAGDTRISVRSAALGDVILAGQSRWYLVYYRDPTVLGGCPAASTFNATQTLRIDWSL